MLFQAVPWTYRVKIEKPEAWHIWLFLRAAYRQEEGPHIHKPLPESALPVTVGLYYHVRRFGFAGPQLAGADGWEILLREKEPDESMLDLLILISPG